MVENIENLHLKTTLQEDMENLFNRKINRPFLFDTENLWLKFIVALLLSIIYFRKNANKRSFAQICLSVFYLLLRKLKIDCQKVK